MPQTYVVCEKCSQMNRVQLDTKRKPVCGACKAPLPLSGAIVEASDAGFQNLINKSPIPVVVDVWAPWCAPCRAFAPIFEEFSARYAGKVVFVKLNSDQNQRSAGQLGIRGIPTVLIFKNGVEVTRQSGLIPREQFARWLDQHSR